MSRAATLPNHTSVPSSYFSPLCYSLKIKRAPASRSLLTILVLFFSNHPLSKWQLSQSSCTNWSFTIILHNFFSLMSNPSANPVLFCSFCFCFHINNAQTCLLLIVAAKTQVYIISPSSTIFHLLITSAH